MLTSYLHRIDMDGILYILLGFFLAIISIVFLFFKSLRKAGIICLIVSVVVFFVGAEKCSNYSFYGPSQDYEEMENVEREEFENIISNGATRQQDSVILSELERYKRYVKEDSVFIQNVTRMKERVEPIQIRLLNYMNRKNAKKFSFIENRKDLTKHVNVHNWKVKTVQCTEVGPNSFACEGYFYTENLVFYHAYLYNYSTNTVYWTALNIKEINFIYDFNKDYENKNKYFYLSKASVALKRELAYFIVKSETETSLKGFANKINLEQTEIKTGDGFVPMMAIARWDGNSAFTKRFTLKL